MSSSKTDDIVENSKNYEKMLNFYLEKFVLQMCSNYRIFTFFHSKVAKKQNKLFMMCLKWFFANLLARIDFLSDYLSYGSNAILKQF